MQKIKRGKRNYGAIYESSSGKRFYLAYRRNAEIFRFGEASYSDAIRKDKAAWALDIETLLRLRSLKIHIVGILERELGDVYLTDISKFFDTAKVLNYAARGGALQRYLSLSEFKIATATRIRA